MLEIVDRSWLAFYVLKSRLGLSRLDVSRSGQWPGRGGWQWFRGVGVSLWESIFWRGGFACATGSDGKSSSEVRCAGRKKRRRGLLISSEANGKRNVILVWSERERERGVARRWENLDCTIHRVYSINYQFAAWYAHLFPIAVFVIPFFGLRPSTCSMIPSLNKWLQLNTREILRRRHLPSIISAPGKSLTVRWRNWKLAKVTFSVSTMLDRSNSNVALVQKKERKKL